MRTPKSWRQGGCGGTGSDDDTAESPPPGWRHRGSFAPYCSGLGCFQCSSVQCETPTSQIPDGERRVQRRRLRGPRGSRRSCQVSSKLSQERMVLAGQAAHVQRLLAHASALVLVGSRIGTATPEGSRRLSEQPSEPPPRRQRRTCVWTTRRPRRGLGLLEWPGGWDSRPAAGSRDAS